MWESKQTPVDSGEFTVLSGGVFPDTFEQTVPDNSNEFEYRKPDGSNENYNDFLRSLYRYDLLKRAVRDTGKNFNPVIENPSQNRRDDFKDFRDFQANLNKDQKPNSSGRFIRDLGTNNFSPVLNQFEYRRSDGSNENYNDLLKRSVREANKNFNPVIENQSQNRRDDFKDFRNCQTNLNKDLKPNLSGRFIRDLGTNNFSPVLETSSSDQIMREGFADYRDFQRQLNLKQGQDRSDGRVRREISEFSEESETGGERKKRMVIFRPLFVYRDQQYKRQRPDKRNVERELAPEYS